MFSWLKKHFIPHEGNEHRPHILRDNNARNVVAIILLLEIFTFLVPILSRISTTGNMAAVLPGVLSALTNDERKIQNLQILAVNPILNKAAEMKAQDMASKGYFAHTSPEGKTPWYWLLQAGYNYQYAGENLAVNFNDSMDVTNAWMASPTHKANIVKGNYTEIGTGVASGRYNGMPATFVAQVYANPLPKTFQQTEPSPVKINKIEIKKIEDVTGGEPANVLGSEVVANTTNASEATTNPIQQPTFFQKLLASPRNTTNMILFIIFGIIFFVLLLYLFIKMNHHKDLITNGLFILAVIGVIFIINYYWSHGRMVTTESLDYSIENK